MGILENNLIKEIQIKTSKLGWRLFRNQTGTGYQGQVIKTKPGKHFVEFEPGDIILRKPRFIEFGLVKGSHDMIGWRPVKITQEMVGRILAVFTSREVKTKNVKVTKEQLNFERVVNESGGDAKIVYSLEEIE
jgi:hypothetical protein